MTDTQPTHRNAHPDCQVLVVGAGPTGLVLAAELLARGVRTRIIDKGDGVALETRALAIHARTLEVLDLMGLAERFVDRGQIVRRFRFYTHGRNLLNLDLSRCGSRFGFLLDLPQHETEGLLRVRVAELGGEIEQGVELVGLSDEAAGVTATVRDRAGQALVITAGFVVGCDGAHSRVRRELGLPFEGHPYPQDWLLADVRLDWDRREDEVHAFFRADPAPLICFPMREHRWRLVVPFAGHRDRQPPTLQEIQQLVDQRAPEPIAVSDPSWLANFQCHRRSTDVYRRGHVLLAGDAVHIHTPAGGQGMNTGIMDAHNLGWKLALVASGRSPDQLLDTYGEERGPVAAQVLSLTHALVRFGTMSHPAKRALRDTIVPAAGHLTAIQRRAARRLTQMHVAYPSSRLTRADHGHGGGPGPGQRAPDIEVLAREGTTTLYRFLRRGRHVMLVSGADPASTLAPAALTPYRDLFEAVTGSFDEARRSRGGRRESVALIRPDGYIAARGTPGKMTTILGYLRELSGNRDQPTRPAGSTRQTSARPDRGSAGTLAPPAIRPSSSSSLTSATFPAVSQTPCGRSWHTRST